MSYFQRFLTLFDIFFTKSFGELNFCRIFASSKGDKGSETLRRAKDAEKGQVW